MIDLVKEKEAIKKRFEDLNDADLILAIKSLLDFGLRYKNQKKQVSLNDVYGVLSPEEAKELEKIIQAV